MAGAKRDAGRVRRELAQASPTGVVWLARGRAAPRDAARALSAPGLVRLVDVLLGTRAARAAAHARALHGRAALHWGASAHSAPWIRGRATSRFRASVYRAFEMLPGRASIITHSSL